MTTEDRELLQLFQQRNDSAIRKTEERYGRLCLSAAIQIAGNREDAEECLNDGLLRLWNAIPPAEPENLGAYLLKTVRNLAYSLREKQSVEKRGSGQLPLALDELANCLAAKDDTETQVTDSMVLRDALNRFLASLNSDQRTVFVLRYWSALEVREIADRCGISVSKVKMSLMRTRNKLKAYLEQEGLL